jgi:hypothetical protein
MPRKSAAALSLVDPRGHWLEPPPGLSAAERVAFGATVRSVKPGHFAREDLPLLTAYAAAQVQERSIADELAKAETATAKDKLWMAHGRVSGSLTKLARALRLGAMARDPTRSRRRPGTVEASGASPWEWDGADGKPN